MSYIYPHSEDLQFLKAAIDEYKEQLKRSLQACELTGVFDSFFGTRSYHQNALDWIELSREVLKDSVPLTPEERASINDFFWSHFE